MVHKSACVWKTHTDTFAIVVLPSVWPFILRRCETRCPAVSSYTTSASLSSMSLFVSLFVYFRLSPGACCIHQFFRDHVAGVPQLQGESNNTCAHGFITSTLWDPLGFKEVCNTWRELSVSVSISVHYNASCKPILAFKSPAWLSFSQKTRLLLNERQRRNRLC